MEGEGLEEGCEEKNKKTEGESANGRVNLGWLFYAVGDWMFSLAVIRRIFKVLLVAASLYPLSRNKQSARFFSPSGQGGRREVGRNGLCFRFQLEGKKREGARETPPRCNGGEGGKADKRKERKKKRRESSRDHAR